MVDEHSGAAYLGEVPTLLSTTPAALELTPEATPPNPAPSPPPRPANARDFGGRTLRIGAWWPAPIYYAIWYEPRPETSRDYEVARMMWENARRIEREFNVQLEYVTVPYDDFLPTLATSFMPPPFADVVVLEGGMQVELVGRLIQPWCAANLPDADIFGEQIHARPCTIFEGRVWTINPQGVDIVAQGLGVNLDIIHANGLPNPLELFEAGQWTWDAMLEIMRDATADTTGDGVVNQFGIAGQPNDIIRHLIGANDGILVGGDFNFVWPNFYYALDHPNTRAALEFAETIFSEGLWAHEPGGVMIIGNWERNFFSGKREGNAALFPAATWSLEGWPPNFYPHFNFGFVPFPTGPNNTTGNTSLSGLRTGLAVPVGVDWWLEDILFIMEELFAWSGDNPDLIWESGETNRLRDVLPTEADVQRYLHAHRTQAADIGMDISEYYWVLGFMAYDFHSREMTAAQAIEYHRAPQQAILDRRFRP